MKIQDYCQNVFFEGKITNIAEAKVPIMTNALQYGNAIFGGIRGYYNKNENFLSIFRIEDHYKRFLNSLKILNVSINYNLSQLIKITTDLAKINKPKTDVYFRPFAYAKSLNISPSFHNDKEFGFAIYMLPLGEYLPVNKGLSVMISSWRRVNDNAIPARAKIAGSYINSSLAHQEALDNGFDEAIFLTENGVVSEGSAANFFIVRDGVLITSLKTDNILEGITRKTIIELAKDLNIKIEERPINRSELYTCDEAFFCGTGVQVAWVAKIDNRLINEGKRGKITEKIQNLFFEIVYGNKEKYKKWNTKIFYND